MLGRAIAIAEPQRDLGNGQIVIPLTRMLRDAHGNLVQKIEYYYGTGTIPVDGSAATAYSPAADRNGVDRYTTMLVDGRNNVLRTRRRHRRRERSRLVQRRAAISRRNGRSSSIRTSWPPPPTTSPTRWSTMYRYDEVGQQTQIVESQRYNGVTVTRIADYNAFGEIIAKYNQGAAAADKTVLRLRPARPRLAHQCR